MQAQINNSLKVLKQGGLLVYPTDTVWGLGCDAKNELAISKIFNLKNRPDTQSLIVLVSDINMLNNYISTALPKNLEQKITAFKTPTTVIYSHPKNLAKNIIASDGTLAIRITKDEFCKKLIDEFGGPIVSTSANISGDKTPFEFKDINPLILKGADYVVNLHRQKKTDKTSTILKLDVQGHLKIIRP